MSIYRIHKKYDDIRTTQEFVKSLSKIDRKIWNEDVKSDFESSMNGIIDSFQEDINHLQKGISPNSNVNDFFSIFCEMEKKSKMLIRDYTNYRYKLCLCAKPYD